MLIIGSIKVFRVLKVFKASSVGHNDCAGQGSIPVVHVRTRSGACMEEPRILGICIFAVFVYACVVFFVATHKVNRVATGFDIFWNSDKEGNANAITTIPPACRDVLRNLRDALEARPCITRLWASGIVELRKLIAWFHVVRAVDLGAVLVVNLILG